MLTDDQLKLAADIVKEALSIRGNARDKRINLLVRATADELKSQQGIDLDGSLTDIVFLADYAKYRYTARDDDAGMPRHLQWRLHNRVLAKQSEGQ